MSKVMVALPVLLKFVLVSVSTYHPEIAILSRSECTLKNSLY